jgi:hypothetical protein
MHASKLYELNRPEFVCQASPNIKCPNPKTLRTTHHCTAIPSSGPLAPTLDGGKAI